MWNDRSAQHPSPPAIAGISPSPTAANSGIIQLHPRLPEFTAGPATATDPTAAAAKVRFPTHRRLVVLLAGASPTGLPESLVTIVHYSPCTGNTAWFRFLSPVPSPDCRCCSFLLRLVISVDSLPSCCRSSFPNISTPHSHCRLHRRCRLSGSPVISRGSCLTA